MHDTVIRLKDGRKFVGPLNFWRPEENWLSLMGVSEKICFDDIASGETVGDRIDIYTVGNKDVLERARHDLAQGRLYNWEGYPKEKYKWEEI